MYTHKLFKSFVKTYQIHKKYCLDQLNNMNRVKLSIMKYLVF